MANWKTTLGGACSAAGSALMGIGVLTEFNGTDSNLIRGITLAGFILNAAGAFFGHLFAADAKQVSNLTDLVNLNTQALKTGDTSFLPNPNPPTKAVSPVPDAKP